MSDRLPPEILAMILTPLSLPEKLLARAVCARWKEVLDLLLQQQEKLRIRDEGSPAKSSSCFAHGLDCESHCFEGKDEIPLNLFRKMVHCNSVSWFASVFKGLRVMDCPDLRMTQPILRVISQSVTCLSCHSITESKTSFPSLIHLNIRSISDPRFLTSCPNLRAIECWGMESSSGFAGTQSMIPISRRDKSRYSSHEWNKRSESTTKVLDTITSSPAAQGLRVLRMHEYNEEAKAFTLPELTSFTMTTGFKSNSDRSRKVLLTSIGKSQKLVELNLVFTGLLANEWIRGLTPLSSTLTRITLRVQEEVVLFISRSFPKLEQMTIMNGKLTDASINVLKMMQTLTHVSLIRADSLETANKITNDGILGFLRGSSRMRLKFVSIESRNLKKSQELEDELRQLEDDQGLCFRLTDGRRSCKNPYSFASQTPVPSDLANAGLVFECFPWSRYSSLRQ